MIGRIDADHAKDSNYGYIIGDDKLSSDLRPISEAANRQNQTDLDYRYNDPNDPNSVLLPLRTTIKHVRTA